MQLKCTICRVNFGAMMFSGYRKANMTTKSGDHDCAIIRLRTLSIASVADHDETVRRNNFDLYAAIYESTVIFDLSRSQLEKLNYDTLESIKNGMIFSTKYELRLKLYMPPRMIVFMNKRPELHKNLSDDRPLWLKMMMVRDQSRIRSKNDATAQNQKSSLFR